MTLSCGAGVAQMRPARLIILIGPPGSGKTVQAKNLSKKMKVPAISLESLIRAEMGRHTELGGLLAPAIASGELVSQPEASALVKARLMRADAGKGFILDGYPTTPEQAESLNTFLAELKFPKPVVVLLDAPDQVLRTRMNSRRRADDDPATIDRRLREYRALGKLAGEWYGPDAVVRVGATGDVKSITESIVRQVADAEGKRQFNTRPEEEEEKTLRKRPPAGSTPQ